MTRHLSPSQVTLLVVGIFLIGSLLILLIYVLHKAFQRQRESLEDATPHGETRTLGVFLSPCQGKDGQVESAVCLVASLEDGPHS